MLYFQSLLYVILHYMETENMLATKYGIFLQPVMVISILLGIYSLTIATKTVHTAIPGNECVCVFKVSSVTHFMENLPILYQFVFQYLWLST